MLISCPLTQMTTIEKLQIMENIWDDLCRKADEVASPFWHEDILKEREKAVEDGSETFTDWERAKKEIRKIFPYVIEAVSVCCLLPCG